MLAMVLDRPGVPLRREERPTPEPGVGEVLVAVAACAVCRTDLHIVDGDLTQPALPLVPGHEIVGRVEATGRSVSVFQVGERVGIPWLGGACGQCAYCARSEENLCDEPVFTGYTRDGGFATHVLARADFAFALPAGLSDVECAPLMCAGLIGWRSLVKAGDAQALGIYGIGAAAHLVAQVARAQGRRVYAFTRPGDAAAQALARELGCVWAGGSDTLPGEPLDAAIIFAPVGALVLQALRAVRKGGRVVCGGIHMSDIPSFPYRLLWEEREVCSVANLTRRDAQDFLETVRHVPLKVETTTYPLAEAIRALSDLRDGRLVGAAVLVP
jgi:propanol-preferring alcohol dehydrogenase